MVVHEYEKIARRVGLIVLVLALVIQILANEIPSLDVELSTKLIVAVVLCVVSFWIAEVFPGLLLKEKKLCGLYIIIYDNDSLCSIVNIDYNRQRSKYSIDIYDCYLQGGEWISVENQYPINLDNIYYDLSPRGLHLVSNNDICKTCIFIRFTYKTNSGSVTRYGSQKPFNKSYSGYFKKLSKAQLCQAFNSQFNDSNFCDMLLSEHVRCQSEGRENCEHNEKDILDKVRKKGRYLEIPKMLYNSISSLAEPSGKPKLKKKRNRPQLETGTGAEVKKEPMKEQL